MKKILTKYEITDTLREKIKAFLPRENNKTPGKNTLACSRLPLASSTMKVEYYDSTDTIFIPLSVAPVVETREINSSTTIDLDAKGNLVSITLEHARERTDLAEFTFCDEIAKTISLEKMLSFFAKMTFKCEPDIQCKEGVFSAIWQSEDFTNFYASVEFQPYNNLNLQFKMKKPFTENTIIGILHYFSL